ncbi:ECM32, partial [Symbiodinium pilosum]
SITSFVDDLLFGSMPDIQDATNVIEVNDAKLNRQQLAAVEHAKAAKLTLVQGPPGTGK